MNAGLGKSQGESKKKKKNKQPTLNVIKGQTMEE